MPEHIGQRSVVQCLDRCSLELNVGNALHAGNIIGEAMRGWISISHVMVSCRGLLQNRLHRGLKRFGRRPRLRRFNLLARELRFQFSAQVISSVFGLV